MYNYSSKAFLVFLPLLIIIAGCESYSKKEKKNNDLTAVPDVKIKPPSSYTDTVVIESPAAVFYNADSLQLQNIRAITDSSIYKSMQHDCFYQMRYSRNSIQRSYPKIRIIEVVRARWLLFKFSKEISKLVDLNEYNDPCGIFLFDGKQAPILADMTNIDTELGRHFPK